MLNDPKSAPIRVDLKYMSTDPGHAEPGATSLMQGWEYRASEPLLDGPTTRRVAVIDFDPETGAVVPGARLVPQDGKRAGFYRIKDERDPTAPDFQQVSVFTVIMKMMALFEAPDVLGRPLRWAFDGEQLLVVPRAGKMANAFYHRDSRSLQFFFFDDPENEGGFIYSCLSPDIVAHETTHAILDGIAPDLYNATSPQSLAMHEAIADLGAVMLAVRTQRLQLRVLQEGGGNIGEANPFNAIAQQFGEALYSKDRPLRDLAGKASFSNPDGLDLNEPHDLSVVLTSALYAFLVASHEKAKAKALAKKRTGQTTAEEEKSILFSASGLALFEASEKLKRIAFRALDYLPPGEIAFADYARAMIAADAYTNPDDTEPRTIISQEFKRRGMVADVATLEPVPPAFTLPADLDLDLLIRSDWAAYQLAEQRRADLLIPKGIAFEIRPRLDVTRYTWRHGGVKVPTRALIFKVAWQESQQLQIAGFISDVSVTRGTTLAIDWETREPCTLLSTSRQHPSQQDASTERNNEMREAFLRSSLANGDLELGSPHVQIQGRTLRVRALGQLLHLKGL